MNKILFVSVHPDDETLGCGGTILRLRSQGYKVFWLNLTGISLEHPFGYSSEFLEKIQIKFCSWL